MDLIKIGEFIAECRKNKKLTQEGLAEKLNITDRAVSKWERGLSLPDADKMLALCNILDININELLKGEKIDMKDMNKKTEELLIEMSKLEEIKNKKIILNAWLMAIISLIFYIGIILLAAFTLEEGFILGTIIVTSTTLLCLSLFYAFKVETDTGYYECKKCHYKFVPSYFTSIISPHMMTSRYLKCPKCNKKSWTKKVMTKEEK